MMNLLSQFLAPNEKTIDSIIGLKIFPLLLHMNATIEFEQSLQKFYEVEVQLRRYPPKSSFFLNALTLFFTKSSFVFRERMELLCGGKKVVSMQVTLSSFYRRSIVVPKHLLELA